MIFDKKQVKMGVLIHGVYVTPCTREMIHRNPDEEAGGEATRRIRSIYLVLAVPHAPTPWVELLEAAAPRP